MNSFNFFYQSINSIQIDELNVLIVGDSIANGTSNGTVDVLDGILNEYRSGSLNAITTDLADANTGGYMAKFAERINQRTGGIVNVIEAANGGSEFSPYLDTNNWSTSGDRYAAMKIETDGFTANTGKTVDVIVIILGINDSRGTTDLVTIETDAISLIDRLETDFPSIPKMIYQLGRQSGAYLIDARWLGVRDIISNGVDGLVETYTNVHLAGDLINDYGDGAFYDLLHLNQATNNLLGSNMADFYIDTFL
jgi:hypothetical protein